MDRHVQTRLSALSLLVAALLGVAYVPAAPPAAAQTTCDPNVANHCYGIVNWLSSRTPSTVIGGDVVITGHSLATISTNWFVTDEEWVDTNVSCGARLCWVEEGYGYGDPWSGPYWYWADQRPNGGGYHEHELTIPVSNYTSYDEYISSRGGGTWAVVRTDVGQVGTSTSQPGGVYQLQAGVETDGHPDAGNGEVSSLRWIDSTGARHTNWNGDSVFQGNSSQCCWPHITTPTGDFANAIQTDVSY